MAVCEPTSPSVGVQENAPEAAVNVAPAMPEKDTSAAACVDSVSAVTVKATASPAKTSPAGAPVTVKSIFCASASVVTEIAAESGESPKWRLSPSALTWIEYSVPSERPVRDIDVSVDAQDPATAPSSHTS